jgi:hypothetical protein
VQFAVPVVTDVVSAPVPAPPVTDTMIPVTRSPLVVAVDSAGWFARSIVMVVTADDRESNTLSASRVATTRHVPTVVKLKSEPETEHDAEPASDTKNDTVPEPEPPEVVNVIGVPYVPLTEVTTSVACVALINVSVLVICA